MTEFPRVAGELSARPIPHVAAQRSRPRKARARARTPGAGEGLDGENDVLGLISQASPPSLSDFSVLDFFRSSSPRLV